MAEAETRLLYNMSTAAFQALVAVLILAASRRDPAHRAFALLFGLNAVIALDFVPNTWGPWAAWVSPRFLDVFTGLLLVLLMARFPAPPRDPRVRRALRVGLAGAAAAWVVVFAAGGHDPGQTLPWANLLLHTSPLVLAGALLFLRMVPGYLRLDRGPLQTQTLLVAAAFGVHFMRLGVSQPAALLAGAQPVGPVQLVDAVAFTVLVMYGVYALARVLGAVARDRVGRPRHLILAGFIVSGAGFVLADRVLNALALENPNFSDVSLQIVRPLTVAYAMVRFDIVALSPRERQVLVPAAVVSFLVMTYLLALKTLELLPAPLGPGRALSGLAALLATAAVGAAGLAVAPRLGLASGPDPERIEAYRLALERARLEAPTLERDARLAETRRRLRIRDEEHDLLQVLLERHVFVPAGSVAALRPGEVLAGTYEIVRELGRGGFGRALLAKERHAGGLVVVKELLFPWMGEEGPRASLRREFEAARSLDCPHVARSLALLEDGPQLRLVRAYVPGRTLREVVEREGPLTPARAAQVMDSVLRGLEALHALGLLHLDLKPENVVLDENNRAVLIDFGAARTPLAAAAGTRAAPTLGAPRTGTLGWMAPEQLTGGSPDERTDVFAAGALLHYALTARPHTGDAATPFEIEEAIVRGRPPRPPSGLPAAPAAVLRRALLRRPERRFPSAAAMREALASDRRSPRPAQPPLGES